MSDQHDELLRMAAQLGYEVEFEGDDPGAPDAGAETVAEWVARDIDRQLDALGVDDEEREAAFQQALTMPPAEYGFPDIVAAVQAVRAEAPQEALSDDANDQERQAWMREALERRTREQEEPQVLEALSADEAGEPADPDNMSDQERVASMIANLQSEA